MLKPPHDLPKAHKIMLESSWLRKQFLFSVPSIFSSRKKFPIWKSISIYELDYAPDFLTSPDCRAVMYLFSPLLLPTCASPSRVFLAVSLPPPVWHRKRDCPCVDGAAAASVVRIYELDESLLPSNNSDSTARQQRKAHPINLSFSFEPFA